MLEDVQKQGRRPFSVLIDVVCALFVREMKTRFGTSRLGYVWAIGEPVAMVIILASVFALAGREPVRNMETPLLLLTGVLPFNFFRKLISSLTGAVSGNKALFVYRQVAPIDPLLSRLLIETGFYAFSYTILLLLFGWFGHGAFPHDPLGFVASNLLLALMGFGFGLCLCCAAEFWPDMDKLTGMMMRPMFFLSGVFFVMSMVPRSLWVYLEWNPILHLLELGRSAFFAEYTTEFGVWEYPIVLTLLVLTLGTGVYRLNRHRLIAS